MSVDTKRWIKATAPIRVEGPEPGLYGYSEPVCFDTEYNIERGQRGLKP